MSGFCPVEDFGIARFGGCRKDCLCEPAKRWIYFTAPTQTQTSGGGGEDCKVLGHGAPGAHHPRARALVWWVPSQSQGAVIQMIRWLTD